MKHTWISRTGQPRLILICAGWSTDARAYADIARPGWDVLVLHSFTSFRFDECLLAPYRTIYLYAWSLGVYAAQRCLTHTPIAAAFAVNGTHTPRHDLTGIPCAIYDGTRDALTPRSLAKFRLRMAADRAEAADITSRLPEADDITSLQTELTAAAEPLQHAPIAWTRIYISEGDRIFPHASLRRFAETQVGPDSIITLQRGHFIPLAEIVDTTIHHLPTVGRNFSRSAHTYPEASTVQQQAAIRLTALAAGAIGSETFSRLLEIGHGTGTLSRLLIPRLRPQHATYADLYPTPLPALAHEETLSTGDAELMLRHADPESLDAIISASAVQWFAHLRAFLADAARSLRPGGLLAISTYGPDNLRELAALRPSPIIYHSAHAIRAMLAPHFSSIRIEESHDTLTFPSARAMLMHLKATGVAGSPAALKGYPKGAVPTALTYHTIAIVARR